MVAPRISVVVPTYERADLLARALRGLLRQTLDPAEYEILVVDNDSGDLTRETVARMNTREIGAGRQVAALPLVRYVVEARPGVSHAKNTGLQAARGDIVAFIDDDAIASPDWLKFMMGAFEQVKPAPHVVGGPAFPLLIGQRPVWYKDAYETLSWGEAPRFLEENESFYGLNVAFRRQILLDAGGFDSELGMKGEFLGFAEDTEVMERLRAHVSAPLAVYYVPDAFVLHLIPDGRVNPHYRLKRAFVLGQTQYLRDSSRSGPGPFALWPRRVRTLVRMAAAALLHGGDTPHYGSWMIERGVPMAFQAGYIAAALGHHVDVRRAH